MQYVEKSYAKEGGEMIFLHTCRNSPFGQGELEIDSRLASTKIIDWIYSFVSPQINSEGIPHDHVTT